jgi:hypothetical protein
MIVAPTILDENDVGVTEPYIVVLDVLPFPPKVEAKNS